MSNSLWLAISFLGLCGITDSNTGTQLTKPVIISTSHKYKVLEGNNILLECNVQQLGKYVVLWRKGDRILAVGRHLIRKDGKVLVTEGNALKLNDVSEEDAGQYVCEVDVGLGGQAREVRHQLQILVAPVITKWDLSKEVRAGDDVTISCEATGNPKPQIYWRKHQTGKVIIPDPSGKKIILRNIGRRDNGLYICKADNDVNEGVEKITRITVTYAPEVRLEEVWLPRSKTLKDLSKAEQGTFDVRLVCHVHANPPAQVSWFKNDHTRLSTSDKLYIENIKGKRSVLRIEQLSPSQFGEYKCRATNSLGKSDKSLELSGRPRPPLFSRQQREILNTVKEVNLTWSTDSLAPVTQYNIHYRKSKLVDKGESSTLWLQAVIPVSEKENTVTATASYLLRDLDNESVYDVKVRAINMFGMSNFSKVFNFYVKTAISVASTETDFVSPRFLQTETKEPAAQNSQASVRTLLSFTVLVNSVILLLWR